MKFIKIHVLVLLVLVSVTNAVAQKTEITLSFSEQFFDALLDAVFQYAAPPEFPLALTGAPQSGNRGLTNAFAPPAPCSESIKLLRENSGKRTGVRFRDGRITAPLAFSGNYNPPFIGCVPFFGVAETIVDLEFDDRGQRLLARARVSDVALNGSGGIGGSFVARMVQSAIDRKINPIEIVKTDKVSFVIPLQNSNSVRMRATGFTHEVANGQLIIHITYEFEKTR
ncbi:MAG: hypothetical protein ABIO91_00900 [Pyrinomonadaceae bacterium]